MKILITGANGFLGKNLRLHLSTREDVDIVCFTRDNDVMDLQLLLKDVDFVFHLAGMNRPEENQDFLKDNIGLTQALCDSIKNIGRTIPVIFSSSVQAEHDVPYGASKRAAENHLFNLQKDNGSPVFVFRLPNVFGKWCKPNYNSVVATFCYNIARGLPIQIINSDAQLKLVYVDDVIERFVHLMDGADSSADVNGFETLSPQYTATVANLAEQITAFNVSRTTLFTERVGAGLKRALYSTYLSYLQKEDFSYRIPAHVDSRGRFVELLKTPDCGQFSYFTAEIGVTRGGHYHHTKTEKFIIVSGKALFKFRHMDTGYTYEIISSSEKFEIVETVPGWTHDVTNIGGEELIVIIWANEVFDPIKKDTYMSPL